MLTFTKELLRHSCRWTSTEDDCKNISGFPETMLLNVNEGYEVLHFVCRYMTYRGWCSQATFQEIESILKTRLPYGIQSHRDTKEWLDSNFRR